MPLSFTDEPAKVGEASRPLAAPFWAGSAPRTPTKSDADADADADSGAVALARPEVRAGKALASLGRGVVIGAFPA